jgi:hypothetical protein
VTLTGVPAFTMIALVWLGVQAEAQTPCPELVRLRNAATAAWKEAMRGPSSERCGALYHASLAAQATLNYAKVYTASPDRSASVQTSHENMQPFRITSRAGSRIDQCLYDMSRTGQGYCERPSSMSGMTTETDRQVAMP